MNGKKYLKIGEAAKFLGIPTHTLRHLEETGEIPPTHRSENGTRLYSLEQLSEYKAALKSNSTATTASERERRLKNTVIFLSIKHGFRSYTEIIDNCQRFLHRPPDERYAALASSDGITRQDIDIFCETFSIMPPGRE